MKIIGLTGRARAGKDTTCEFMLEWCKDNNLLARRYAFADLLKVSAAACFGVPRDRALAWCNMVKTEAFIEVYVPTENARQSVGIDRETVANITGREFLQNYGTEAHREVFHTDFWVYALLDNLDYSLDVAIITDARFENECEAISGNEAYDGQVWEVIRPPHGDELEGDLTQHASEAGVCKELLAGVILNTSGKDTLRLAAQEACKAIFV